MILTCISLIISDFEHLFTSIGCLYFFFREMSIQALRGFLFFHLKCIVMSILKLLCFYILLLVEKERKLFPFFLLEIGGTLWSQRSLI